MYSRREQATQFWNRLAVVEAVSGVDGRRSPQQGSRPNTEDSHIRLSETNAGRDPRRRQVVTLVQFDSIRKPVSRPRVTRPGTGTNSHASRRPGRGALIDPDNSRKAFTHAQRPRGGVRARTTTPRGCTGTHNDPAGVYGKIKAFLQTPSPLRSSLLRLKKGGGLIL